ncbi:Kinesin-like protein nack1 [Orobanche gracilis]
MTLKTPGTPASKIDRTPVTTPGGLRAREEKIVVTVRLRPLNKREQSSKDQIAWDCTDDQTIAYRLNPHDRAAQPTSYVFDKVFGPDCSTESVYEDGVRTVALSALMGINATIFAYGQTSSGKTYTMRGITDKAVNDIYMHIMNVIARLYLKYQKVQWIVTTPERDFKLKISGLEIYNENVRDLLNSESDRNLKLLDDPEKGTVVEKLVEETAKDNQHLRHLIHICDAQRQVGETALNDTSSRSHQIIRLTIESTLRENSDCVRSYVASLNFVDLAGSERASQTNAEGARLREGCHINLSLMTLTTVIRKLRLTAANVVGKRSGHIPYRDSKLTRILQHSLGGNARTAIVCTLSPASSHVEQSRNTLLFATRAKEVTNNAQVNMVVSEKQLVKHLQKEVARLEAELRTPDPSSEKDMKIREMEREMEELRRQRDLAQSQVDDLRRKLDDEQRVKVSESPTPFAKKCLSFSTNLLPKHDGMEQLTRNTMGRQTMRQSSTAPFTLMHEIRKLEHLQEQLGEEANRALEVLQKEVACHRLGNQDAAETIAKLQAEIREMRAIEPSAPKQFEVENVVSVNKSVSANLKEEITRLHSQGSTIAELEEKLENVQKSIDKLVMCLPANSDHKHSKDADIKAKNSAKKKKLFPLASSNNINMHNLIKSPCSPLSASRKLLSDTDIENRPPASDDDAVTGETEEVSEKDTPTKSEGGDVSSKENTPYRRSSSVNMRKMQRMFQNAAEENVRSIKAYVTELKERVAKLQYQKQLLVCQVLELEANEAAGYNLENDANVPEIQVESPASWQVSFREQRQQIIELWDVCYVSIIHRTQFYLLFKGDPADEIYMEVELRRLAWLQQHLIEIGNASPAHVGNDVSISVSSSLRALKREREFLAKRLSTRLTAEERDVMYMKWEVPLEGKQRRMQFINKLWSNPHNERHVEESADIVAKLVGFCEGGNMSKEMFELNFVLPSDKRHWFVGWNQISDLLHL